jgi:hypothetical protein
MRRHISLTVISLALGTSTVWLAIELHAARQELVELRDSSAPATTAPTTIAPVMSAVTTDIPAPEVQVNPVATSPLPNQRTRPRDSMQAHNDAAQRAANLAHNAWVRSWLDDPEKRGKVLAEFRKSHERDIPRQLLDLDDADFSRLLDTQAAGGLRYAEAMYRCNTDPACDLPTAIGTQNQANRRELVALLGDEKTQRLEMYRDNYMERSSVANFRSGLPDSMPLSDAQAERLADALGEERRGMVKEWQQRGEQIGGMGNAWGSLNFPETQDVERRVAAVTEFQRRQRDRAAEVLTSAQFEIFAKQQEQMLEIVRGSWEFGGEAGKSP